MLAGTSVAPSPGIARCYIAFVELTAGDMLFRPQPQHRRAYTLHKMNDHQVADICRTLCYRRRNQLGLSPVGV